MISATQQAELLLHYIKQGDRKNPHAQTITMPTKVAANAEEFRDFSMWLLNTIMAARFSSMDISFLDQDFEQALLGPDRDLEKARIAIQKNYDDTLAAYRAQLKVVNTANNALTAATTSKKATAESIAAADLTHQEARTTLADTFTQFMNARGVEEYYRNFPTAVATNDPEDILWAVFNVFRTDSYCFAQDDDTEPTSVDTAIRFFTSFVK
jgi:hypothetical protein